MATDAALFQAALEATRDGILVVDPEGGVIFSNGQFASLFGLTPGAPIEHDEVAAAVASPLDSVAVVRLNDGRILERSVVPFSLSGSAAGRVATYRDITKQSQVEAMLEEHRTFLENAPEVAHIGNWVAAFDGSRRMSWSPEMFRIHGITPEQFGGTSDAALAFVHEADRASVLVEGQAFAGEDRSYEHEHRIIRADGAIRWVRTSARIVRDAEGKPQRLVGTSQDVTDRRELEEQLRQSQKMEAIGRLAGGIAHDLNNALTAIAGFAELALGELPPDHKAHADVIEVRKAAARAGAGTRQLLAFSRRELLEPRVFNIGDTVDAIGRFLGRLLGEDVQLDAQVSPGVLPIVGDPGQVEQAIVNLAVNARDAMPHGGRLTLAVTVEDVDETFARTHVPMEPGRYVALSVSDTGHGMSPETRARIFEPFFTTKPVGKGTGLGLSMVYGTIKQSGGFVYVESEVGVGTTFRLYFPPAQVPAAVVAPPSVAPAAASVPTVLVVDDEPSVLALVVATLRNEGYRILQASSGDQAFKTATAPGEAIDLLLTDATMPGKGGIELARDLLERWPALPVIVMSGYTQDHLSLADLRGTVSVCQKPFTPGELRERVRQALNR